MLYSLFQEGRVLRTLIACKNGMHMECNRVRSNMRYVYRKQVQHRRVMDERVKYLERKLAETESKHKEESRRLCEELRLNRQAEKKAAQKSKDDEMALINTQKQLSDCSLELQLTKDALNAVSVSAVWTRPVLIMCFLFIPRRIRNDDGKQRAESCVREQRIKSKQKLKHS